ncbi:hypothetical protein K9N08_02955 [Candidatus Gracilibacteria bacterium]|nr:hypothetical protein [Candidatus Gracilibacteria bacterium]MCF7856489.1 hypothetical protein [Candidatus Gracilibacteria bacterium]MCF7896785.1 hypothetical protein [Candidatus Gracilibacteria bacterium]
MSTLPSRKRFLVAIPLGLTFGILCAWLASRQDPTIFNLKSFTFWTIVSNRLLIGAIVGLAGAYKVHPFLGFRIIPIVRGAILGTLVSLTLAFGALIAAPENATQIFWLIVGTGAIYGMIIDLVATKIGGEGKALLT